MKKIIYLLVFMVMTTISCEKPGEPGQGGIIINPETGLVSASFDAPTKMAWEAANTYCENLTLDGYNDWRLPTWDEMEEIAKHTGDTSPWINKTYWTKDPVPSNDSYKIAYSVQLPPQQTQTIAVLYVRPVRKYK